MIIRNIISNTIPAIKTSDSGTKAISIMEEFKVSHLPIVNNIDFLGLISILDIYNMKKIKEPVGGCDLSLKRAYIYDTQHIYDAIKIINEMNLSVLPILNIKNEYLGLVELKDIVNYISNFTAIKNPGGIIIIELNINDYSLSEISQIVESNDVKIISLYIDEIKDSMKFNITLKLNKQDLTAVLRTFERYNYNIKASFGQDNLDNSLENRYNLLMNYLNL